MSTKKSRSRLQTIPEFVVLHPQFTEYQVRYALRRRHENGLAPATFRRANGRREVLIDPAAYVTHLTAVVPA